jgi:hypothetical protein
MTPERAAELVGRWVRFYTRELPVPIAQRRIEEIDADVHEHIAFERARGTSDRRITLGILSRMARGLTADVSWRRWTQALKGNRMKRIVPFVATALAPAALGVAAIVFGEADDAPGLVLFGILLVVGALAFGTRPTLRSKSRVLGFILAAIVLTAIGSGVAGWLENNF